MRTRLVRQPLVYGRGFPHVAFVTMVVVAGLTACTSAQDESGSSRVTAVASAKVRTGTQTVELGDRPFRLHVPAKYRPDAAASLVVALHGWGGDADALATRLGLVSASERRSFLLAMPEGVKDADGLQFWNATDACCDVYGTDVDDSGYLSQVINAVADKYVVDQERVFVIGISNGGFMAHRLACDHADQVAAIVSISGAQSVDPAACDPSRAVSVLEVHGSADDTVLPGGGKTDGHRYPSVRQTVGEWRELDQCDDRPGSREAGLDAAADLPGAETVRTSWSSGCADNSEVALWTVRGGPHVPDFTRAFTTALLDWLMAQARSDG